MAIKSIEVPAKVVAAESLDVPARMTAAVLYGREDVRVESMDVPQLEPGDALVRVKVALTCGTDLKVWRQGFHARMIKPPSVFGHEFAGTVERIAPESTNGKAASVPSWLRIGSRVTAANSAPCGECFFCRNEQSNLCEDLLFNNGAYAEYIRIPARIVQRNLLEIPDHVPFTDAAMVEPLACVLRGIHETGILSGQRVVLIGCGPLGLKFVRVMAARGVNVIALAKRPTQLQAAERLGACAALDVTTLADVPAAVRQLTGAGRGADAVIEAVGSPVAWGWAMQMVRRGGTINLFGGCPAGTKIEMDATALHYSEITVKSSFHHTPRFIRESLDTIARGEIRAADFVSSEIPLSELPASLARMKDRGGEMKLAVVP